MAKQAQKYPERHMLCLHGCNQTQSAFESYMKQFVKIALQHNIKCHFLEGMYDHPKGGKTWFKKPLDLEDIGVQKYDDPDLDTRTTLDQIHKAITENNCTLLLGFSQGGNVADTYVTYHENNPIEKLVVFSGYSLVDDKRKDNEKVSIINVTSDSDEVVKANLMPIQYVNKEHFPHDKGHKIPGSEICRKILDSLVK